MSDIDPSIVTGGAAAAILSVLWALVRTIGKATVAITLHLDRQEKHRKAEARHWLAVERALAPKGERPTVIFSRDPGES